MIQYVYALYCIMLTTKTLFTYNNNNNYNYNIIYIYIYNIMSIYLIPIVINKILYHYFNFNVLF